MKKLICLLLLVVLTGCGSKKEETEPLKISSTGELLCAYKEKRTNEETMYTSLYQYNYNRNGILEDVINTETIEYSNAKDSTKDTYKKLVDETIKEYKDIAGISVEQEKKEDKVVIKIKLDIKNMKDKDKEKYLVNEDRINTYKIYTSMNYTCE